MRFHLMLKGESEASTKDAFSTPLVGRSSDITLKDRSPEVKSLESRRTSGAVDALEAALSAGNLLDAISWEKLTTVLNKQHLRVTASANHLCAQAHKTA